MVRVLETSRHRCDKPARITIHNRVFQQTAGRREGTAREAAEFDRVVGSEPAFHGRESTNRHGEPGDGGEKRSEVQLSQHECPLQLGLPVPVLSHLQAGNHPVGHHLHLQRSQKRNHH